MSTPPPRIGAQHLPPIFPGLWGLLRGVEWRIEFAPFEGVWRGWILLPGPWLDPDGSVLPAKWAVVDETEVDRHVLVENILAAITSIELVDNWAGKPDEQAPRRRTPPYAEPVEAPEHVSVKGAGGGLMFLLLLISAVALSRPKKKRTPSSVARTDSGRRARAWGGGERGRA